MRIAPALLLALAGCGGGSPPLDPLKGRPVAAWRSVPGVPVRRVLVADIGFRTLMVPALDGMMCMDANSSNGRVICGLHLAGRTGRPTDDGWAEDPEMVDANFYYTDEDNARWALQTRSEPDQLAGHGGDLAEAPVLDHYRGRIAGRDTAVGCWRETAEDRTAPIYCELWIAAPGKAHISARYWAGEVPDKGFRLDRPRLERIVRMLIATEASFNRT